MVEIQDDSKPEWTRFTRDDHAAWRVIICWYSACRRTVWLARGEYHKRRALSLLIGQGHQAGSSRGVVIKSG